MRLLRRNPKRCLRPADAAPARAAVAGRLTEQVEIAGQSLELRRIAGAPRLPTLVFLHQGLGCAGSWRDYPDTVCNETGCAGLVYSRLGYGSSAPAPLPRAVGFMHDEAETLTAVLDALDVRRTILIGHSDGGSIALLHAGKSPDEDQRLAGLVLEAPHLFVEQVCVDRIAALRDEYRDGELRVRLERWHGEQTDEMFAGWTDIWLDPAFLRWNIESTVSQVRCPMLAFQGTQDPFGTMLQLERLTEQATVAVRGVPIEGCGHHPHREAREPVLRETVAFIKGLC